MHLARSDADPQLRGTGFRSLRDIIEKLYTRITTFDAGATVFSADTEDSAVFAILPARDTDAWQSTLTGLLAKLLRGRPNTTPRATHIRTPKHETRRRRLSMQCRNHGFRNAGYNGGATSLLRSNDGHHEGTMRLLPKHPHTDSQIK